MERTANRSPRRKALGGVLSGLCWLRLTASVFGCDVRVFLSYTRPDRNHRACRGHGPGCPPVYRWHGDLVVYRPRIRACLLACPACTGRARTDRRLLRTVRVTITFLPAAGRLSVCRSARRPVARLLSCQFITSQHAALVRRACHSEFHTVCLHRWQLPHESALPFGTVPQSVSPHLRLSERSDHPNSRFQIGGATSHSSARMRRIGVQGTMHASELNTTFPPVHCTGRRP